MENESAGYIAVGRVSKTFGLGGELAVSLYDTFSYENTEEPVFIWIDNIRTPFYFKSFRPKGTNKAVVVFDDIETEYRASEFVGLEFFRPAPEDEMDSGEFATEDLVGFRAEFEGREEVGEITGYLDSEFNPLFEILVEDRELLVPAADEFVIAIDPDERIIVFDIPNGLWELEE